MEAHFKHRAPEHSFYSFMAFDNLGWVAVAISTDKQGTGRLGSLLGNQLSREDIIPDNL